ncbi:GNAT family N-acetyltransferase [Desulfoferula mesophila]|uniref:N-acetyltransferase domain-containing protein n=1 Tax=Desulfoferula mesophila TaxID=3058419 RepID=A0AAU9EJV2_9BACT|nr:hypothetical protein FAK_05900 [Desulfoferula mesophilus]
MISNELIYRGYQQGDERLLKELCIQVFNEERSIPDWQWEFMDTPEGPSNIRVIEDKGAIVGHIALIPIRFQYMDKEIVVGKSEDSSLREDYRGKRLFGKLEHQCFDEAAEKGYAASYSISRTANDVHIKAGYHPLKPIEGYFVPLRSDQVVSELKSAGIISGYQAWFARPLLKVIERRFRRRLERAESPPAGITIERMTRFTTEFDDLWRRFACQNRVITIKRSSAYLNWRFNQKPNNEYEIYAARCKGELVGYLVCTSVKRKGNFKVDLKIGVTSDFLFLNSHQEVLAPLIYRAANYWVECQCDVVINWVHRDSLYAPKMIAQLKKLGLVSMLGKYSIPISVRALRDEVSIDYIANERNWFFTLAFSGRWA